MQPDLAGFASAQVRLRTELGVDAVFITPGSGAVWPSGTALDPETDLPYDPFLEPVSPVTATEVTVRCSFVQRPFAPGLWGGMNAPQTPIGTGIDRGLAALIVPEASHAAVADATRVRVGEEVYDIDLWRYDQALTIPRWIAYLEHS